MSNSSQEFDHRTGNDGTGYYIRTFTGRQLFWDRVEEHDFDIRDIAHALACRVRWSGHVKQFYSIAQHSCLVCTLLPMQLKLAGLLHDANEAYLPDFPSPLKWYLRAKGIVLLKDLEDKIDAAIAKKFNFEYPRNPAIKIADLKLLAAEHSALMPYGNEREYMVVYGEKPTDLPNINPWPWEIAEDNFLHMYSALTCT
jgi:uncharacterized protein